MGIKIMMSQCSWTLRRGFLLRTYSSRRLSCLGILAELNGEPTAWSLATNMAPCWLNILILGERGSLCLDQHPTWRGERTNSPLEMLALLFSHNNFNSEPQSAAPNKFSSCFSKTGFALGNVEQYFFLENSRNLTGPNARVGLICFLHKIN